MKSRINFVLKLNYSLLQIKNFFYPLLILIYLTYCINSTAQVTLSLDSQVRTISSRLIGYNGRSTEGPSWSDQNFLKLVEQLNPGMVRYPAGTQANYWDWRTGNFIVGSGKLSEFVYTIDLFTQGLPDSTGIVYVVNMARPTPSTGISINAPESVLKSDNTLQLKITDMLAALNKFKQTGRFPEAIELGNEFYFTNEHAAIYAGDPELYLDHSKKICQAVKAKYPDLKILLCTTKGGTASRDYWNNTVFSRLSDDPVFAGMIAGVVQHHYISDNYGDPDLVLNNTDAQKAIAEAFQYVGESVSDYNLVPQQFPIWLTEYGATKPNADGMWAAGLRSVAMTMACINLGIKINRLFYHHITNDPDILNKSKLLKGPSGISMALLAKCLNGKSLMRKINISNNITVTGNVNALHAFKSWNSQEESVFILNISSQSFNNVGISDLFAFKGQKNASTRYSLTPYLNPVYEGNGVTENNYVTGELIDLKPFSINLITVKNTTKTSFFSENIAIYPTTFNSFFIVDVPAEEQELKLKIISKFGQTVHSSDLNHGENIITPVLPACVYFCCIENKKEVITKIIICLRD
ncbi:MAG: T9SS type A sorting domain-containing protein [Deltaproteobacteria bacterium]